MDDGRPTAWKGLRTETMPVFIGYDQAERMVAALLDGVMAWRPEAVVAIVRGGLVPGTMAACALGLPLAMVGFDRRSGSVAWIGPRPDAARVLLVDDSCSTGSTLHIVRGVLLGEGFACATLCIVHDPETTAYVPDFSHPVRELFRLPWERGEATPRARAARATGGIVDRAAEQPFLGLDLDGVFLPDVPRADYAADLTEALRRRHALEPFAAIPPFHPERAVIITGRPEMDREPTADWLARHGFGGVPLECRPSGVAEDLAAVARFKAEAATRWGCTHFVESEPEQAIRIAALAPHLLVAWWSADETRAWIIGAVGQPDRAPSRGV